MLTLAAFFVFMLISPGFCLLFGIRRNSKHDLRTESENTTTHLIALIVLTTLVQIITVPIYIYLLDKFGISFSSFRFDQSHPANFFFTSNNDFNSQAWLSLGGYIVFVYLVSYKIGAHIIKMVECGCLKVDYFHGPLYEFIRKKPQDILCTVTTKIQHDGMSIMYRGSLRHIFYEGKHKIKYVVLSHVTKFTLQINKRAISTSSIKSDVSYRPSQKNELFYIEGSEVSNILFSEFPYKSPTDDEIKEVFSS